MSRVWQVFLREYRSTVLTGAFIFGAFVFPVVFYTAMIVITAMVKPEAPQLTGTIAIYDASGKTSSFIRNWFNPALLEMMKNVTEDPEAQKLMKESGRGAGGEMGELAVKWAAERLNPWTSQPLPDVVLEDVEIGEDSDLQQIRTEMQARIRNGEVRAFIEIGPNVLTMDVPDDTADSKALDDITVYVPPDLHHLNMSAIEFSIKRAVLFARAAVNNTDLTKIQWALETPDLFKRTVTEEGDEESIEEAALFIPIAFMMLLFISTFTGGQYLMMSTIEEKSSRVMEVLLSAVTAKQMMTGKILGQGAVALTLLAVYAAMGLGALNRFDLGHLLGTDRIIIFIPYFFMAFMFVACMMAAIGSAVTDVREAQALMSPVMMVMLVPFMVMFPIIQNPNSMLSVVVSFIPPLTPFIMAMRLGGNQEIAAWQIAATLVLGFAAVWVFLQMSAKIFRIGVLMYGKPPNVRTLVKWVMQA
jgi:ABC-2 type transport system permease protein